MKSNCVYLGGRLGKMFLLKRCLKCHGDLIEREDVFGKYLICIQCGSLIDLANLDDETQDTPERVAQMIAA